MWTMARTSASRSSPPRWATRAGRTCGNLHDLWVTAFDNRLVEQTRLVVPPGYTRERVATLLEVWTVSRTCRPPMDTPEAAAGRISRPARPSLNDTDITEPGSRDTRQLVGAGKAGRRVNAAAPPRLEALRRGPRPAAGVVRPCAVACQHDPQRPTRGTPRATHFVWLGHDLAAIAERSGCSSMRTHHHPPTSTLPGA
jgi:hypothetical protein